MPQDTVQWQKQPQPTSASQLEAILVNFFDSLQATSPSLSLLDAEASKDKGIKGSPLASLSLLHLATALNMTSFVRRLLSLYRRHSPLSCSVAVGDYGVKGHQGYQSGGQQQQQQQQQPVDEHGNSALDWALALGHFEVAAVLREHYCAEQTLKQSLKQESNQQHQHLSSCAKSLATSIVIDQPQQHSLSLSSASTQPQRQQQQQQQMAESFTSGGEDKNEKKKKQEKVVEKEMKEEEKENEEEDDILLDNVSVCVGE